MMVGRKRKLSVDFKESRKKSNKDKILSADSTDQLLRQTSGDDTLDSKDDQDISKSLSASNNGDNNFGESDQFDISENKEDREPSPVPINEEPAEEENIEQTIQEENIAEEVAPEIDEYDQKPLVVEESVNEVENDVETVNDFLAVQTSIDESIDERASEMVIAPSESYEPNHDMDSGLVPDALNDVGDVQGLATGQKKRKKRASVIAKEEITEGESTTNGNEADNEDNGKRYQSSRNAAKVAKSKFGSGKANRTASNDGANTTTSKSGKKNQQAANLANVADSQLLVKEPTKTEWIQCDECSKWRSIPPSAGIDIENLPEKWFCFMNTWDEARNTCEAEEENYQTADGNAENSEIAITLPDTELPSMVITKEEKATPSAKGKGKGKGKKVSVVEIEDAIKAGVDEGNLSKDVTASGRKRGVTAQTSKNVSNRNTVSTDGNAVQAVNWVQCNKCKKWRKAPNESFPEKWYCSLNTWNLQYASCSVRQEEDDTTAENNVLQQTPHRGGKKGGSGVQANSAVTVAAPTVLAPGPASAVVKKNWVQCERKGCKKWRKVPASIDIDSLPEKWYCEMNTWNPDSASCDAPEDVDSDAERNDNEPRNQFILSGPKGPTALSYRRIIFGNDGKIKACFSDKNKNGYGLFSYNQLPRKPINGYNGINNKNAEEEDEHIEPMKKIAYWWSSAYEDRLYTFNHLENSDFAVKGLSETPTASSYLLDTARRIFDCEHDSVQPKHTIPKKLDPAWSIIQSLSLFTRCKAECSVIRSAFLAQSQSQLTLFALVQAISKCKLFNPVVESCRQYMTIEAIRDALHRLEEADEVDIAFSPNYEMVISLLLPLSSLRSLVAARSKVFHHKENKPAFGAKWAQNGVPLKLRKFYVKRSPPPPVQKIDTQKEAPVIEASSSGESDYDNSRLEYHQNEDSNNPIPTVDAVQNPEDFVGEEEDDDEKREGIEEQEEINIQQQMTAEEQMSEAMTVEE